MSWKEFKEAVESEGVQDADEIFYIDTGNYPQTDRLNVTVATDEEGARAFTVG